MEEIYLQKLAALLQEKEDEMSKLNNEHGTNMKDKMNEIVNGFKMQTEGMKDTHREELAELREQLSEALEERNKIKKELELQNQSHKQGEDELKKRLHDVRDQLRDANERNEGQQQKLQQMSADNSVLEHTNLDLRQEILALQRTLDSFENVHQIKSPVPPQKRRRTNDMVDTSKATRLQIPTLGGKKKGGELE